MKIFWYLCIFDDGRCNIHFYWFIYGWYLLIHNKIVMAVIKETWTLMTVLGMDIGHRSMLQCWPLNTRVPQFWHQYSTNLHNICLKCLLQEVLAKSFFKRAWPFHTLRIFTKCSLKMKTLVYKDIPWLSFFTIFANITMKVLQKYGPI